MVRTSSQAAHIMPGVPTGTSQLQRAASVRCRQK
jgi:hypothetical protein